MGTKKSSAKLYDTMLTADVPHGRSGKHKLQITRIIDELARLAPGSAIKIPLKGLPDTKENVRSALNRATRKAKLDVATAADDTFLYVWNK